MSTSILRLPTVCARVGLKKSTIYALIKAQKFPAQVSIANGRAIGWASDAIDAFVEQQVGAASIKVAA